MNGQEIARAFEQGELCGWAESRHPGLLKEQFSLLSGSFRPFAISGQTRATAGRRQMLYQACRQVLGRDTPNYAQEIGDCTSFGYKNALEYLMCADRLVRSDRDVFRPVFPPYIYGASRVYVGQNRVGSGDGSMGVWCATAIRQHGVLFADEPGVPKYSGAVAKAWGDASPANDLDKWQSVAKRHPGATAKITTWDELVAALVNWYPVPTASEVGYEMEPRSDGFHYRGREPWAHQMTFIGVDDNATDPYAILLNSWGDCHGKLRDFQDGHELPPGCLRVRRREVEAHLAADDTYAVSNLDGFPEQLLDKKLFDLVGD